MNIKKIRPIYAHNSHLDFKSALITQRLIENLEEFTNPDISKIHDPQEIYGCDNAAKVILEHLQKGSKIFIHGDFDVDGICSTSMLWDYLYNYLGANVKPFIPNRFEDGYGLSESTVKNIINQGGKLIISVDCGVKDIDLISKYANQIDFVITDHHAVSTIDSADKYNRDEVLQVGEYLLSSKARAIMHPKINEKKFEICGAFVAWDLIRVLHQNTGKGDPFKFLDLVAMGTVCDVMPLIGDNRIVVKKGIEVFQTTLNLGLRSLAEVAHVKLDDISVYHLGFIFGPRLNASGRLETAMDAVRLLCTKDPKIAHQLAVKLDILNKERQDLTKILFEDAEKQIELQSDYPIKFIYGENWAEGIVGLVAGKLSEKYYCPVIVGSLKNETLKASVRSIEGFNIIEILRKLSHLLEKFGGHALAAGLTIKQKNIDQFLTELQNQLHLNNISIPEERDVIVDYKLDLDDITIENVNFLETLEPFGYGNKTPLFHFTISSENQISYIGKDLYHVKFNIRDDFELVGFNLAQEIKSRCGGDMSVLINLEKNVWRGNVKIVGKIRHIL
jgi:single-stranded-DNA-specific exonuclease